MMSNNFVELKGSVFKKFDKNNLFQVNVKHLKLNFQKFIPKAVPFKAPYDLLYIFYPNYWLFTK